MKQKINLTKHNHEAWYEQSSWRDKYSAHYYRYQKYNQLLKYLIRPKTKVLDIGCGEGNLLALLPKCDKSGLDLHKKYFKQAQRLNPSAKFRIGENESLPYKDASFDIVICTEVIEHIDDTKTAFKEIYRVLKNSGWLLISTYNHWVIFNILNGWAIRNSPRLFGHVKEYNWHSFRKLISQNGFISVKSAQAASSWWFEGFCRITRLPMADFMILLCKKRITTKR